MRIIGSERMIDFSALQNAENAFIDRLDLDTILLFSSGRSSINFLFSRILKNSRTAMPDMLCSEVIRPARLAGAKVSTYRINNDFTADLNTIDPACNVIFIIDFYGFRDTALFRAARDTGKTIVIDRTHSLLSSYERGDYELGSFRKIFPVPDGGFLTGAFRRAKLRKPAGEWPMLKLLSKTIRRQFELMGPDMLEQMYVRLSESSESSINIEHSSISEISEFIINHYPVKKAALRRRKNFRRILEHFKCPVKNTLGRNEVPQSFPVLLDNRDTVKACLAENAIFAPVLWRCNSSPSSRLLNIPCDEEYSQADIDHVIHTLRRCNAGS